MMDESLICECGNDLFWFFWDRARCSNCFNEYKKVMTEYYLHGFGGATSDVPDLKPEFWMRRFNKEKNQYHDNWEKSKITYKK